MVLGQDKLVAEERLCFMKDGGSDLLNKRRKTLGGSCMKEVPTPPSKEVMEREKRNGATIRRFDRIVSGLVVLVTILALNRFDFGYPREKERIGQGRLI